MTRKNPLRGVHTLTLKKLMQEARRVSRRRPLTFYEQLMASVVDVTLQSRINRRHRGKVL